MNKTAIRTFAVWARTELIRQVSQKAFEYGITRENNGDPNAADIGGRPLTAGEREQRGQLIARIGHNGFESVMEETAYTWFNRFIALRFMEVNGYLPSRIRLFTNDRNEFYPEILAEAMHAELDGLDRAKVVTLIESSDTEALYKYLLITQCNALSAGLPGMFERISNYTELLFPNNLLKQDSVLERMVTDIPEEDWTDAVEIIGWLYQYYNTEPKDEVINIYKGTVKKEDIPAATQLFTTDWVVRYMVDNSLGKYWIERNPNSASKSKLRYYFEPKVADKREYAAVSPQDLTFFDPCCGSGHILVYAFDVLMAIYEECGYSQREAAEEILKNNIFGLDIDDRAGQLAYFAVMMKARSYNHRILTAHITPWVGSIQESNNIAAFDCSYTVQFNREYSALIKELIIKYKHAKEIGTLQTVCSDNYDKLEAYLDDYIKNLYLDVFTIEWIQYAANPLKALIFQAKIMSKKFTIVCTNPPYMNKLEGNLKSFVTDNFKNYAGDLFSAFIFRNFAYCKKDGYCGFMTPFVWMFIKTYEQLRQFIINNKSITSLIQMEYSAFEEATVPICTFVIRNNKTEEKGMYIKLSDFKGGMEVQRQKVLEALKTTDCKYLYSTDSANFSKIPGMPIAYWVSDKIIKAFMSSPLLVDIAKPRKGLDTSDNDKYVRYWYEPNYINIYFYAKNLDEASGNSAKWYPLNSGGSFRKWYGNLDRIINWENGGEELRNFPQAYIRNKSFYFKEGISWTKISSSKLGVRYAPIGLIFDSAGQSLFPKLDDLNYILGILCSKIAFYILNMLNPTLNYQVGDLERMPIYINHIQKLNINNLVMQNITISKSDWDSFETSWNFKKHPLMW